ESFSIDVSGIAPVISSTAVTSATVNQAYSYDVDATGIPEPNYALITSPNNMGINPVTGLIEWIPDVNQISDVNVTVEAHNIAGTDTQSFTIAMLPSDDFDDNRRSAMWRLFVEDYSNTWVVEHANQVQVRASGDVNNLVAFYVANGWSFDVNEDFAVQVDFHYSGISYQDGWVGIIVSNEDSYVSISTGSDSNESHFYYQTVVDSNTVFEQEPKDSNNGTLYISYDANSNDLYLSCVGYGRENAYAWQTTHDPLQGSWVSPVDVVIGGGSDGVSLGPGEAYLDNFKVIGGKLIGWPPATDLDSDGFIGWGDIGILSKYWLGNPNIDPNVQGDLNNDDIVNFLDFAELGLAW
ncbi:MAG: putative Ig domain-containing protein, partial [Planctomycetota bacterium]